MLTIDQISWQTLPAALVWLLAVMGVRYVLMSMPTQMAAFWMQTRYREQFRAIHETKQELATGQRSVVDVTKPRRADGSLAMATEKIGDVEYEKIRNDWNALAWRRLPFEAAEWFLSCPFCQHAVAAFVCQAAWNHSLSLTSAVAYGAASVLIGSASKSARP